MGQTLLFMPAEIIVPAANLVDQHISASISEATCTVLLMVSHAESCVLPRAGGQQQRRSARLGGSQMDTACHSTSSTPTNTRSATLHDTDTDNEEDAAPLLTDLRWLEGVPEQQLADLDLGGAVHAATGAHVVLMGRWAGKDVAIKFWEFYNGFGELSSLHR